MRWYLIAAAALLSISSAAAQAQTAAAQDLISIDSDLNGMCRGYGPIGDCDTLGATTCDTRAWEACNVRKKVWRVLGEMGYCYGKRNQTSSVEMQWHKCTKDSCSIGRPC